MNKYKFFGILASGGIVCTVVGAWAKILHLRFANTLLTIGLFSYGVGIALLVWFLFVWLGKNNA
jgi:hypothetical protein